MKTSTKYVMKFLLRISSLKSLLLYAEKAAGRMFLPFLPILSDSPLATIITRLINVFPLNCCSLNWGSARRKNASFWSNISQKKHKNTFFWPVFFTNLPAAQKVLSSGVFRVIWESSENQFG